MIVTESDQINPTPDSGSVFFLVVPSSMSSQSFGKTEVSQLVPEGSFWECVSGTTFGIIHFYLSEPVSIFWNSVWLSETDGRTGTLFYIA